MGKSCGKILWENLAGNGGGEKANLRKAVIGGNLVFEIGDGEPTNQDPAWENLARKSCGKILQENLVGTFCGKFLLENLVGNSCGKILQEILAGKSCGKRKRGEKQFKKGSDWCKFSIWNRVMGSQPMMIQVRKILWEIVLGNCCGKILWEMVAGKSCRKILWEILLGNCCRKKSQFKKGSDWWKFSIWNRVMGSQPIRIQLGKILRENLAGKSCRKLLWENLVGNCCGKLLLENLAENCCGKILWENLAGKSCGKRSRGKTNLRKVVIGGNLAFGIG